MTSVGELSLRIFALALGLVAATWGVLEFPAFLQESIDREITRRILVGDIYKPEILLKQASFLEDEDKQKSGFCRPLMTRSWAVIRLRIAEISDISTLAPAPDRTQLAVDAFRKSLSCSPSDPFLWLALFALEPSAPIAYLAASYRLGPNEGWIALKRNPVAFANFDDLPNDLRDVVVQEFLKILEMATYDDAVKIFVGPAWDERELILSKLEQVSLRHRESFAKRLAAAGYDVPIPGTESSTLH